MNDAASKLFNQQRGKLNHEYNSLSNVEKNEFCSRCNISDLFLDDYDYDNWFVPAIESDEKAPPMPPLEGHEEVNEEKGINILYPNKLLIRLPV